MFSQARAAGLDIDGLGARMLARKQELMARFKADGLPSPETRTFTGHDLEMGALLRPPKMHEGSSPARTRIAENTRRTRQGQAGMDQLGSHGGLALIQRRRRRVNA
jgi:hypothetical protein